MPANNDNYQTLESVTPSATSAPPRAQSSATLSRREREALLVPPYVTDTMGPVRLVDADLECVLKPDGMYHYCYVVRVIPDAGGVSSSSDASVTSATSARSALYPDNWTVGEASSCECRNSTRSRAPSFNSTQVDTSVCATPTPKKESKRDEQYYEINPILPNASPLEVTFAILYKNRRGEDCRSVVKDSFDRNMVLHDVLWANRQKFAERFDNGYQPALSMAIGDGDKRDMVLGDIYLRLNQLCDADVTKLHITCDN